ncbi:MAG: aldo/keto reductase [Bacillus sp. (in: firmicutes)]
MKVILQDNFSISKLVIGCMRMNEWNWSVEQRLAFVEWCIEQGITTFDHADIYGGNHHNEALFGEVLQRKPSLREKIQIITKCSICVPNKENPTIKTRYFNSDRAYIMNQVNKSLAHLKCGSIDLLLLHMHDLLVKPEELNETIKDLKTEGKVKNFGLSNHNPLEFDMLQKYIDEKFVTHQFLLNPLGIENFKNGTMTHCLKEGIHPMFWSPLAGGKIFQPSTDFEVKIMNVLQEIKEELCVETLEEVVYKWLFMHASNPVIVLGTGKKLRIEQALHSLKGVQMTREQWYKITETAGYVFW